MVSVFPELLSFGLFAPFLLRIVLGVFFIVTAVEHSRQKQVLQIVWPVWAKPSYALGIIFEILVGILLVVGLFTQVAALAVLAYTIKMLVLRGIHSQFAVWAPKETFLYIMILVVSLSLLVLGAGIFAIDFPL